MVNGSWFTVNGYWLMFASVTIAVPVYGVERYIERCARSLFEQTWQEIEYLFVDDCSPDRSMEILRRVLEDYPERKEHVRIIRHERNRGLGAARNTAVENCRTEFIMHVDSDDDVERNAVELVLKKQAENDYDIVRFGFRRIKRERTFELYCPDLPSTRLLSKLVLARRWPGCVWGAMYRTSLYKDNGIRVPEGVNNLEDYCVEPRLAYYAEKVGCVPDLLYNYYFAQEGSFTESFSEEKSRQALRALEVNQAFFSDKDGFRGPLREGTSCIVFLQIRDSLRNGWHRAYYKEMRAMWDGLPDKTTKGFSRFDRVILMIDNYFIACVFYRTARFLYRLIYKWI